jgi:hypothetical protein
LAEKSEALTELRAAEREQTRLLLDNPYLDPQNPGSISAKLLQLEMERNDLERRQREHEADLDAYKQMLAAIESGATISTDTASDEQPSVYASPETRRLMSAIAGIEKKITVLKTTRSMTDRHPQIQGLLATRKWRNIDLQAQRERDREFALLHGPLEIAKLTVAMPKEQVPAPWRADQARLLVQINSKEAKLRDVAFSLDFNELESGKLTEAKGMVFDRQEEYADTAANREKARQRHGSHVSMLSKIEPAIRVNKQGKLLHWSMGEPARGSRIPLDPKAKTIVLLALLAGALCGVIFVVLAEVFDHAYRSADQVSKSLGIPLLAAIDEIVTTEARRRLLIRRAVVAPIVLAIFVGFAGASGSLAYLSIQRPDTYLKLRDIPRAALELIATNVSPGDSATTPNS